jgi:hypothetical protein
MAVQQRQLKHHFKLHKHITVDEQNVQFEIFTANILQTQQ